MMVKPREKRVPIMMSEEEMTAIDDWRFANRVATRSDAIRRLCQIGIVVSERRAELESSLMATGEFMANNFVVKDGNEEEAVSKALRVLGIDVFRVLYNAMAISSLTKALQSGESFEAALAMLKDEISEFDEFASVFATKNGND